MIATLDGEVRRRLDVRRAALEASDKTVIAWVHTLSADDRAGLLAELVAISLDLRETRTTLVRSDARAEAAELAALCEADIARHWTPDAAFLSAHPKGELIAMLDALDAADPRAAMLRKPELVDQVAALAKTRQWAPSCLSWRAHPGGDEAGGSAAPAQGAANDGADDEPDHAKPDDDPKDDATGVEAAAHDEAAGAFVVTPAGEAELGVRVD